MSKHRRPTRLRRLGHVANGPLQFGVAAGVVGTLGVTGTVVATVAGSSGPASAATKVRVVAPVTGLAHSDRSDRSELTSATAAVSLRDASAAAAVERHVALARAHARARAVRQAKHQALLAHRAHLRAVSEAKKTRAFASRVSRGTERVSASAAHALAVAASAASGAYYVHGGSGPSAYDCSGFTAYVFARMGISLPHLASAQAGVAARVSTPEPGDLVFVYNGGGGSIGHVAIYAGNGYWWEAANPSAGVGLHRAWSSAVSYGRVL